ncbi:ATP-binding protein, partial [Candidatus Woesebacteria bacterium]|nr:ATP-binding protein [Candidatus Woesebacteria bacterium]
MTRIKRLPDDVIMRIAAGQVVDKPVSVVKELLENAIDAQSTRISVEIRGGGFERIMVVDNGVGMNKSDVQLCFLPHTTSKIVAIDDLIALSTHGFRGEALASIAAVGSLSIASRQTNSVRGWKVEIEKGACITSEPVGMPPGTRIEVGDLFRDMPVRKGKKALFSKSAQEILDCMVRLSLVYQKVEFELKSDTKRILHAKPYKDPSERIYDLFGETYRDQLIPLNASDVRTNILGFVGKPSVARAHQ